LLRAARAEAVTSAPKREKKEDPNSAATRGGAPARRERRKRKFPYRKSSELEADIATTEARVAELEAALQDVAIYKDPVRLKQTMADLDAAKAALPGLYEHWEEAIELNG
jgi:ATP-binding cassette subfamily F protein 3